MEQTSPASPLRVVVLISGNGSNLQAIIDKIAADNIPAKVVAVISNNPDAYGLTRARNAGVDVEVIEHTNHDDRQSFDEALKEKIEHHHADLVVLAGFMRILTDDFVNYYAGRMINIHPSLLPSYQGLNTHQRVLDAGEKVHGASVHFVTPELDGGPVILQAIVPVKENDTAESLAQRVHQVEHVIYPQVIKWFAERRLKLDGDIILFDNKIMTDKQKHWSD